MNSLLKGNTKKTPNNTLESQLPVLAVKFTENLT